MPFVDGDVTVKEIDETTWQLLQPLVYRARHQTFTVPRGFKTDFATVPRVFAWLVPPFGKYTKAAILHDYLYVKRLVNKSVADMIFRQAMRELGVSFLRRWLMWAAVRTSSGLADAHPREVVIWLLVIIPSVVFLVVPTIVVMIWLTAYWILDYIVFGMFKGFRRADNKPSFLLGGDALKRKRP